MRVTVLVSEMTGKVLGGFVHPNDEAPEGTPIIDIYAPEGHVAVELDVPHEWSGMDSERLTEMFLSHKADLKRKHFIVSKLKS
jgi:hypothetical protein